MSDIAEELLAETGEPAEIADESETTGEEESSTPEPEQPETEATDETEDTPDVEAEADTDESEETEEPEEKPGPDPQTSEEWTYAMGKAERAKRQKAEERVKALEEKLAKFESEQVKKETPSVFDDEEKAFEARNESVLNKFNQALFAEGEALAIQLHDKDTVTAAMEWAEQAASESPTIAKSFQGIPLTRIHQKAVQMYQQEQKRAEMADPEAYRKKVEAEVRAKLKEESKAELEKAKATDEKKREAITPSLASQKSAESKRESVDGILEEIFPLTL